MSRKKKKTNTSKYSSTNKMDAKKAAVLEGSGKSKMPLIVGMIVVAALIGGGVFLLGGKDRSGLVASNAAPTRSVAGVQATSREVSFPVNIFEDGRARYFKYDASNGLQVRYFIMKSSDGIIRAAFDSCDVCWTAKKGYRQEGDVMVCNNCGQRFPSIKINEIKGGCNPAPLNREVVDGKVIIKVSDIIEGGNRYFNLS